jgi:glycosyltransferase involved in cell wall biosynthesis
MASTGLGRLRRRLSRLAHETPVGSGSARNGNPLRARPGTGLTSRLMDLVDPEWYSATYPHVTPEVAALDFAQRGHRMRRDPCRLFSTNWYLEQYPDVSAAVSTGLTTPALHYVRWGGDELRLTHPAIDLKWMLSQYPDLEPAEVLPRLAAGEPGLFHHPVVKEALAPLDPHKPLISVEAYDPPWEIQAGSGCSVRCAVAEDYLLRGEPAGVRPSPWFDPAWYRSQYSDVAAEAYSLLGHFLAFGEAEGRLALPPMDRERIWAQLHALAEIVPEASTMLAGDPYSWPTPRLDQWTNVGRVIAGILADLANTGVEYVVLVPYFGVGGAEKVANAAAQFFGDLGEGTCLILATESVEDPGPTPTGKGVRAARVDDYCGSLPEGAILTSEERAEVAVRVVLALEPRLTLVVNSRAGWDAVRDAGQRLRNVTALVGAYFCYDYLEDGTRVGYAAETPPSCLDLLHAVVMDNESFGMVLASDHRLDQVTQDKLHVVYQPVRLPGGSMRPSATPVGSRLSRVLWANRICRQKNLGTLLRIAVAQPALHFDVYGVGQVLEDLPPNVHVQGRYDGFATLPLERYCSIVYTSLWDGLPNVLIEAAEVGLPIVAGDVGGISELVGPETGFLVGSPQDVDGYVEALSVILADPAEAARRAANAQDLVARRHSWASYEAQMEALLGAVGIHPGITSN